MSSNYKAGEFYIESMAIVTQSGEVVDIRRMVAVFNLHESIYDMFTYGDVALVDTQNLLMRFQFTGQEYIRISLRQKEGLEEKSDRDDSIDKTFRISSTKNIQRIGQNTQTYVLGFHDPRLTQVEKTRLSKVFMGSYSAMALGVMTETIKLKPEETDFWADTLPANHQFIAPDWTVKDCISHFVRNANTSSDAPFRNSCFFFQTLNGGFRFQDIASMYQREHPVVWNTTPKNDDLESMERNINSSRGLNTQIIEIHRPSSFNTLEGIRKGLYSSILRCWNPITQQIEEHKHDIGETFKRDGHMHEAPIHLDAPEITLSATDALGSADQGYSETEAEPALNKSFDAVVKHVDTSIHQFGNATDINTEEPFLGEKFTDSGVLERNALLQLLQQNIYTVVIPFRTDLSVGTVVRLDIHEPETAKVDGIKDKLNDNRYLVTALKITGIPQDNTGVLTMDCVREGIAKKLQMSIAE
jgi:hypothetical protein|tara:strand:+ start:209 stop:1621 length:1413 start_codon:yes stop_codon:yes gene_type:complete